jgi:hypothetical protein
LPDLPFAPTKPRTRGNDHSLGEVASCDWRRSLRRAALSHWLQQSRKPPRSYFAFLHNMLPQAIADGDFA